MRAYEVTGVQAVFDHEPGETFEAEIPAEQEAQLIESGAIRPLDGEGVTPELGGYHDPSEDEEPTDLENEE